MSILREFLSAMTKILRRLALAGASSASAVAVLCVTLIVLAARSVSAATATAGDAAQAAAGDLNSILAVYGPSIGTMYVAFLLVKGLVLRAAGADGKADKIAAWLRVGKRLAYATSALGVAGAAIQVAAMHAPWTVILATAVAAAFKLITPGAGLLPFPFPAPETVPAIQPAPATSTAPTA